MNIMRPPRVSLITCPRHGRVISFFSLSISLFHLSLFERLHYAREPNASETLEKKRKRERDSMEFDLFLSRERKRNRIDVMIDPGGGSIEGEGFRAKGKNDVAANALHPALKPGLTPTGQLPVAKRQMSPR